MHCCLKKESWKLLALFLLIVILLIWAIPSFAAQETYDKSKVRTGSDIKDYNSGKASGHRKLIIGGDQDYPPYEFLEKGKPTGFNIELIQAVAEVMGFETEIRLGPWNQVRDDLEQGRIDVISGMYYSAERDKSVDFSVPHTLVSSALFVRKASSINTFNDIKGLEIVAQKGDIMHDYLEKTGIASRMVTVENPVEALRLVASGKHDGALLSSELQGQYFISMFKLVNLKCIRTDLPPRKYCFAVGQGNNELVQKLDEGLNILKSSGKYREIYEKWFGVYEEASFWGKAKYIVGALILIVMFFAASIFWSRSLKRQVTIRTEELRLSAEVLRESESRFRQVLENSLDAIYRRSYKENRFEFMSQASEKVFGYTAEEMKSMTIKDVLSRIHHEDIQKVQQVLENAKTSGGGPYILEFRFKTKQGDYNWVADKFTVTKDEQGNPLHRYGNVRDISEIKAIEEDKKHLQEQLHQAQKLESLGVLAGGIAHDFNNILMAIIGNADLAMRDVSLSSPVQLKIDNIKTAAFRASDLCRQLLAYSGKGRFIVIPINLSSVVADMKNMLEISVSKMAKLRFTLKTEISVIEADVSQIQQIILNMVINASEAIGDKPGNITIVTGEMYCNRQYLDTINAYGEMSEGRYVFLDVTDDGCGMDKETIVKIFDPFFTTKFTGRGLGLAATLGIVRGHKGALKIYSEPGSGSTFRVFFPAVDGKAIDTTRQELEDDDWQASGTVLIADDEEIVRKVCRNMLERFGFAVIDAANGRQAVEIFKANAEKISLVLLDLTMPEMGGEEVLREIRLIDPEVPVILSSGYNEQEVISRFIGKNLSGFVQKPYMTDILKDTIRKVLRKNIKT
jgi:PAS domain S-box-containing protein